MTSSLLLILRQQLSDTFSKPIGPLTWTPTHGGCCHETGLLCDENGGFRAFTKCNREDRLPQFEAEAAGLDALSETQTIRVPRLIQKPIALEGQAILLLEWVDLHAPSDRNASEALLGEQLAALHRTTHNAFGWGRDNLIGDTPQINTPENDWITFFTEHRLRYQADLASSKGLRIVEFDSLLEQTPQFFASHHPAASLLHGDLWSGNVGYDGAGAPVIFDPAVYHGDRETDLAFTEMFGGFGRAFYEVYVEAYPLDSGYSQRRDLYNLYHILNHFNLFGGGYGQQAQSTTRRLLSTIQ